LGFSPLLSHIFCFSLYQHPICFVVLYHPEAEGRPYRAGAPQGDQGAGAVDPWVGKACSHHLQAA